MQIKKIKTNELKTHPKNARRGNIDEIINSINANGVYKPLIVSSKTNHILAGNHTFQALKKLGKTDVDVVFIPDLTEEQEIKILLADNKTSDNSKYDDKELLTLLASVEDLSGTGWDDSELIQLANSIQNAEKSGITKLEIETKKVDEAEINIISDDEFFGHIKMLVQTGRAEIDEARGVYIVNI